MLKEEQLEGLGNIPFHRFRYNTSQNVFETGILLRDKSGTIIDEIEQLILVVNGDNLDFTLKTTISEMAFTHEFNIPEDFGKPEYKLFFDHLSDFTKTMGESVIDDNIQKLNTLFNVLKNNNSEISAREILKTPLKNPKIDLDSGSLNFICELDNKRVNFYISIWEDSYCLDITIEYQNFYIKREELTGTTGRSLDAYLYKLLSCFDGIVSGRDFEDFMDMVKQW